ncbi:MAG: hypothetical protein R3C02_20675, partial [Planctomycetaceae bacterium]
QSEVCFPCNIKMSGIMKLSHQLPVIFIVVHSIGVLLMMMLVATQLTEYPESAMLWNLFMVIDFPISLSLSFLPEAWVNGFDDEIEYVYVYGAIFAVFGGLQYLLIGYLLQFLIRGRPPFDSQSTDES